MPHKNICDFAGNDRDGNLHNKSSHARSKTANKFQLYCRIPTCITCQVTLSVGLRLFSYYIFKEPLAEKLVDPLVLNLARAFRWQELIDSGTYSNAIELARAVGKDTAYVARTVRLTLLAPEIIHAILHGTLKKSISMETLRKSWPENWEEQKVYFGLI